MPETKLFDNIPTELFGLLSSYKNKFIYADALFVLYESFKDSLKIKKIELASRLQSKLEKELINTDFDGELNQDEMSLSGRAYFLIRKMKSSGWIDLETGEDFEEYIIIPEYSSKILETLTSLTTTGTKSGFSFVYNTYAILKEADSSETDRGFYCMQAAYSAFENTESLIKTLKSVYHNINYYCIRQAELVSSSDILAAHFDKFSNEIIERYIKPLKIKESIPKYKNTIIGTLRHWITDDSFLNDMAQAAFKEKKFSTVKECKVDLIKLVYGIVDIYDKIESEYLDELDYKVRKYTRITTQKLVNSSGTSHNLRGDILYLLQTIGNSANIEMTVGKINEVFKLSSQGYLTESSLFARKKAHKRDSGDRLIIEDDTAALTNFAIDAIKQIVNTEYDKEAVKEYVDKLFRNKEKFDYADIVIENDKEYVMSMLAVLNSTDRNSGYKISFNGNFCKVGNYTLPEIVLVKGEQNK